MKGFIIMGIVISCSIPALAGEGNELGKRVDFLTRSRDMQADYLKTAEGAYLSPAGLKDQLDAITSQMDSWVVNWRSVNAFFENPPNVTLAVLEQRISQTINNQDNALIAITAPAIDLSQRFEAEARRLRANAPLSYRIEGYALGTEGQNVLERRMIDLANTFETHANNLNSMVMQFRDSIGLLREAFRDKAVALWAERGIATIEDSLRMIDSLFLAHELISPMERDLRGKLNHFQLAISNRKVIESMDNMKEFLTKCEEIPTKISYLSVDEKYKSSAKERIQKICIAHQQIYASMRTKPLGDLMADAIVRRKERIERVCLSNQSFIMNCKLYESIAGLSLQQIRNLSEGKLRQLEAIYNAIEQGQLAGIVF